MKALDKFSAIIGFLVMLTVGYAKANGIDCGWTSFWLSSVPVGILILKY